MDIMFEDYDKKFKSSVLKELENNVKILKNIFEKVLINNKGIAYSINSKIENGRVYCICSLNELLTIPEDTLLELNLLNISECLKKGKTKILGLYTNSDNQLIMKTNETDFLIGEYQENKKLNIGYIDEINDNICYRCNLNDLLKRFSNKEFINIKRDRYDLILTHKLFPMVNKATNFDFSAKMNDDGTFYGVFKNTIKERNKKDEVTFEISIFYIYRFMDLN